MQYKVNMAWISRRSVQSTWEPEETILDKRLVKHCEHGQKPKKAKIQSAACLNHNLPLASLYTYIASAESSNFQSTDKLRIYCPLPVMTNQISRS